MFEFAQIIKIGDKVLFNAWRREIDIFIIILRGVILMDRIKLSRHIKKGDTLWSEPKLFYRVIPTSSDFIVPINVSERCLVYVLHFLCSLILEHICFKAIE